MTAWNAENELKSKQKAETFIHLLLLRTPFSISWSSLTEMAWSCKNYKVEEISEFWLKKIAKNK